MTADDSRTLAVEVREGVKSFGSTESVGRSVARRNGFLKRGVGPRAAGRFPGTRKPQVIRPLSQFAAPIQGDLTAYDCVFSAMCQPCRTGSRRLEAHLKRGGGVVFGSGPTSRELDLYNRVLFKRARARTRQKMSDVKSTKVERTDLGFRSRRMKMLSNRPWRVRDDNDRAGLTTVRSKVCALKTPAGGKARGCCPSVGGRGETKPSIWRVRSRMPRSWSAPPMQAP